ncbi:sigma-70 family RNA polymerase sigma factor [Inquilinus limosus]|uniref:sigma-70 family RNA polymerase sigma factor n=1 Tax=Inquilinus limosus TaxID=171674 RepID=UPI003F166B91
MKRRKDDFDVIAELPGLKRYALVLTRDAAEAEDLLQETLLKAYEGRRSWQPDRALRPWLFAIMHNAHASRLRGRRAEDARIVQATQLAPEIGAPSQDARVQLAQVQRAMLTLPEEQREALLLVAVEEFRYQEAATILGIPIGTLMSRLGRARAALREIVGSGAGDAAGDRGTDGPAPPRLRLVE